jgi:hypothetical protein
MPNTVLERNHIPDSGNGKPAHEGDRFRAGPVRNGDVYCSPWCGASCTWKAFTLATSEATQLAEELGPGWKPDVWENMGWHYQAKNGILEVHKDTHRETIAYTGWCQSNPQVYGDPCATPAEAVKSLGIKMQTQLQEQLAAFFLLADAYNSCRPAEPLSLSGALQALPSPSASPKDATGV